MLARPGVDPLSRYPRMGADPSREGLFKALQKFVKVGYESSTGISTLRVQAFTPADAQMINAAMLDGGERLVNRLNDRASARAVNDAERSVIEAEQRLRNVQARLNMFRNREGIVNPMSAAAENTEIISELATTIATLQAERGQIASQAPGSPQLPSIDADLPHSAVSWRSNVRRWLEMPVRSLQRSVGTKRWRLSAPWRIAHLPRPAPAWTLRASMLDAKSYIWSA